ncbi:MAG: VTT domain-containing protein [Candidatus Liptonbacteria bacterium]|nr:VTT domain-containing protein [Candidatus Liptonbacteria bacterium]
MANVLESLQFLATQNYFFAYLIIFLSAIFIGNIAVFAMLWLVLKGFLGLAGFPLFLITLFVAGLSGDILWYSLGRLLRYTKLGNFIKNHIPRHEKIEEHIHSRTENWIMLAKFIQSSNFPVIFMAGWFKINFKKFIKTDVLAILTWLTVITALSYVLIAGLGGLGPLGSQEAFRRLERLLLPGLVIFFLINHFGKKILEKLLGKNQS